MHTEYFLLTADMTVQVPVTLIVPAQTCGKSRPVPVQNPSQSGAVDKVSQQPSRYVIMRKTT